MKFLKGDNSLLIRFVGQSVSTCGNKFYAGTLPSDTASCPYSDKFFRFQQRCELHVCLLVYFHRLSQVNRKGLILPACNPVGRPSPPIDNIRAVMIRVKIIRTVLCGILY